MENEGVDEASDRNRSMDYDEDLNPFEDHHYMYMYSHHYWIAQCISVFSPIAIFGGIFTNIFAFVVLVRSRLWLKHEGYVYLAANLCVNIGVLVFCSSSFWLTFTFEPRYYPPNTSNFMCKMWHFFLSVFFFAPGWLSVALLFSVYLREHLTHRRRCGCPIFAAKYCTLFASKIIVGVIFSVLFVLGLPYMVDFKIYHEHCYESDYEVFVVSLLVEAILMWFLPVVFFLPIILLMTLCTKREGDSFGFSQIQERSASDEQMKVVAVIQSSMTLFSQFVLVFFLQITHSLSGYEATLAVMAYSYSVALLPIFCLIILKELRDGLRSQLLRIRCCRRLFPSLDRDEGVVQLTAIQEDPPSTPEC